MIYIYIYIYKYTYIFVFDGYALVLLVFILWIMELLYSLIPELHVSALTSNETPWVLVLGNF